MHGIAVWKDSQGTVVPVVRVLGDPTQNAAVLIYEFVDTATGSIWMWNGWKNQTSAEETATFGYNIGGCMGTPYVGAQLPPRYAVSITGKPGFYMMPDNVLPTEMGVSSRRAMPVTVSHKAATPRMHFRLPASCSSPSPSLRLHLACRRIIPKFFDGFGARVSRAPPAGTDVERFVEREAERDGSGHLSDGDDLGLTDRPSMRLADQGAAHLGTAER